MTTPQPGDFFLSHDGPIQASLLGSVTANIIQWATNSEFNHAGVCVGTSVVEAQPGGARHAPLGWYTGPTTVWSNGYGITDPAQRGKLVLAAEACVGVPYGWPDIIAIALAQRKLGKWQRVDAGKPADQQPWWVRRLARTDRLICSQLVDLTYFLAGIHLFNDGRCEGLVSPGDLGRLLNGTQVPPTLGGAAGGT